MDLVCKERKVSGLGGYPRSGHDQMPKNEQEGSELDQPVLQHNGGRTSGLARTQGEGTPPGMKGRGLEPWEVGRSASDGLASRGVT